MEKFFCLGLFLGILNCGSRNASVRPNSDAVITDITYKADDSVFANPERGFYHHLESSNAGFDALDPENLKEYRTKEMITQVLRVYYLDGFLNSDISADYLSRLKNDFATAREAGVKIILRFAYTQNPDGNDAPESRVLAHISQLKQTLTDNYDVIEVIQAGFIGAWGEWYYTQNFGNNGSISEAQFASRKKVVDALLDALPKSRFVQLRVPSYKREFFGDAPIAEESAFDQSSMSRIGHHNDCFVADAQDTGTYLDPEVDMPYLEEDSSFVPIGGETCAYNEPRSACESALADMARYHWSFINTDYFPEAVTQWKNDGCYEEMRLRLGYRLSLESAQVQNANGPGGIAALGFTVKNSGFASPFNERPVELVFVKSDDKSVYRVLLNNVDPRRWFAGKSHSINVEFSVTGIPAGTYNLYLALPDAAESLKDKADFAIRFANEDVWDPSLGANNLHATMVVNP